MRYSIIFLLAYVVSFCITGNIFCQLCNDNIFSTIKWKAKVKNMWRIKNTSLMNEFSALILFRTRKYETSSWDKNQYYNIWIKYELLRYLIFFFLSHGNWVNVRKRKNRCYILLFCPQILHATNLIEVWDWKFKQKYLLIKDDNVTVTFVNKKLKFDVSKIGRLFYQSVSFFKQIDWSNFKMMSFSENSKASVPTFYT